MNATDLADELDNLQPLYGRLPTDVIATRRELLAALLAADTREFRISSVQQGWQDGLQTVFEGVFRAGRLWPHDGTLVSVGAPGAPRRVSLTPAQFDAVAEDPFLRVRVP